MLLFVSFVTLTEVNQLSILSNAPPENKLPIPVQKALILDPWLEPLPSPGPIPHQRFDEEPLPRILVINSEKFTLWKGHFERLIEVGKSWTEGGWELLTIGVFYPCRTNC